MKLFRRDERELLALILNDEERAWNALYGHRLSGLRVLPCPPASHGPAAHRPAGGGTGREGNAA